MTNNSRLINALTSKKRGLLRNQGGRVIGDVYKEIRKGFHE
jgi:hypothetical protein